MFHKLCKPDLTATQAIPPLTVTRSGADCGLRNFDQQSPLDCLYRFASGDPSTLEGHAALQGVLTLTEWYRERGIERVSNDDMNARLQAVLEWSAEFFSKLPPTAQAVVWNGSFLRGRPDAGDVDLKILTEKGDEHPNSDCFFAVETEMERGVREELQDAALSQALCGISMKAGEQFICSIYEPRYGVSVKIVEQGPFLCLVRPENEGGPMGAFFYPSGTGYLKREEKPGHI